MTSQEIYDETNDVIASLTRDGVKYFRGAVLKSGLVQSRALFDSVDGIVINEAVGLGAEVNFTFQEYWRFNDMKELHFSAVPNIEAMQKWVDKIPISQIPWVNGYPGQTTSSVAGKIGDAAVRKRLLNAILSHRKKIPIAVQPKKRLYNKTKAVFVNILRRRLMEKLGKRVPMFIADQMGGS